MKLFTKILQVEDSHGEIIDVRLPSIMAAEEFRARYKDLLDMCQESGIADLPFEKSYKNISKFRRCINNLLSIVGIEGRDLSADMIVQLLFPYNGLDEEGVECMFPQGALIEFVFGPLEGDPDNSKIPVEEIDHVAKLIGEMWGVTEDFREVIDLLNTLPYEDIGQVLEYRNDMMMTAEDRAKKKQKDASMKLMERMKKGELKITNSDNKSVELSEDEIAKFI